MNKFLIIFLVFGFLLVSSPAMAVASQTTLYFGSHEKVVDESGGVIAEKTYLALPHTTVVKSGDTINYLHQDHLSSTRLITDNRGQPVGEYDYYPYGELASDQLASDQLVSDKLYTSQTLDNSTDLYYYHARYYNPTIASFLSADEAEGPNRYAYVGGNPISRNDPSGYEAYMGNGGGGTSLLGLQVSGGLAKDPFEIRASQVINDEDQISRHDMLAYASPLIIAGIGTSAVAGAQALYWGPMLSLYTKGSVAISGALTSVLNKIRLSMIKRINPELEDLARGILEKDPFDDLVQTLNQTAADLGSSNRFRWSEGSIPTKGLGWADLSFNARRAEAVRAQPTILAHELSHVVDSTQGRALSSWIRAVDSSRHYGRFVAGDWVGEAKAYGVEFILGSRSIGNVAKWWAWSAGRRTGGLRSGGADILREVFTGRSPYK